MIELAKLIDAQLYVCIGFPYYQKLDEEDLKSCYFCVEDNCYFMLQSEFDKKYNNYG